MALIDITPIMTSNTTPSPYVISASSIYSSDYDAWKAFNGTLVEGLATDGWCTANKTLSGWIQLDFGNPTRVNAISIYARNHSSVISAGKDFIIYGSDDGVTYEQILTISDQILWTPAEGRLFQFGFEANFRYYKIAVLSNNGNELITIIGLIKFWQDDGTTEHVSLDRMSMSYCLPHNTTIAMKERRNDMRVGMLGYADDPDNYGTLWMIDNKGKAIIPKTAMANSDILFDGVANTLNTTYIMSKTYEDYSCLLVIGGIDNGTRTLQTLLIPTHLINPGLSAQFSINYYYKSVNYYAIHFQFDSETSFQIIGLYSVGWNDIAISKIIGIK